MTIRLAVNQVLSLTDLRPSQKVNRVMSALVESVLHDTATDISSFDAVTKQRIQTVSADAEAEMEKFWARLIVDSKHPQTTLGTFPYLDNYVELTKREVSLVERTGLVLTTESTVLVIGSGPLPLSVIEIAKQTGAQVDQVDSSLEAITLGRQVSDALGVSSTYFNASGALVELTSHYDMILIAALAGQTVESKQEIVDAVLPSLKENGRIVMRSSYGAREILYPKFTAQAMKNVALLHEYHPDDYIINSVFVYGKA